MKNNWLEIKNYYIHNNVTQEECAKKFKVSLRTVQKHCCSENWAKLRKQKRVEIAQKSEEKIIDRKIAVNEKHFELFERILETVDNMLDENINNAKISASVLYQLVEIIRKIQIGQRLCLNMGAEDAINTEPKIKIICGLDVNKI